MKIIFNHFFELFFPRLCVCCNNRLVTSEKYVCISCLYLLPITDHLTQEENKLEQFFAGRFPFVRIASYAYFAKGGSIQKLIHTLKYKNNPELGIYLGELFGKEIICNQAYDGIDIIVPIPLHNKRLRRRGYNQSLMIAKGISNVTSVIINESNLIRKINNSSQTRNNRFERWKNTEGIFGIMDKTVFEGKHILLVDDVVTTGSTLEVCAKLILGCQNSQISIATIGSAV